MEKTIGELPLKSTALAATDQFEIETATPESKRITGAKILEYIQATIVFPVDALQAVMDEGSSATGITTEIVIDGDLSIELNAGVDLDLIAEENVNITAQGNATINVVGAIVASGESVAITAAGADVDIESSNAVINILAAVDINIDATRDVNIEGSRNVTLDATLAMALNADTIVESAVTSHEIVAPIITLNGAQNIIPDIASASSFAFVRTNASGLLIAFDLVNYADDTAADAGGVLLGQLYYNTTNSAPHVMITPGP